MSLTVKKVELSRFELRKGFGVSGLTPRDSVESRGISAAEFEAARNLKRGVDPAIRIDSSVVDRRQR